MARAGVRQMSNMLKQTMDHPRVVGGRAAVAAEGRSTMTTKGRTSPDGSDRTICGEAAYAGVSMILDERLRAAELARRANEVGSAPARSLRTRTGLALVALGTRIGGRALERSAADALPSPALTRHARAGRAG
jgi:hypothetical protein